MEMSGAIKKMEELKVPREMQERIEKAGLKVPSPLVAFRKVGHFEEQDAAIVVSQIIRKLAEDMKIELPSKNVLSELGLYIDEARTYEVSYFDDLDTTDSAG